MLLPESDSTFFSLILWKYNEFYGTLWYSLYEKLVYKSTSCDYVDGDVVSCKNSGFLHIGHIQFYVHSFSFTDVGVEFWVYSKL